LWNISLCDSHCRGDSLFRHGLDENNALPVDIH